MNKKEKLKLMRLLTSEQFGWTLIVVSHDVDVMKICDRTMLLRDGQLVAAGSYAEIRNHELLKELTEISI
jgi:ABC-type branched-subunit amino acid transport system ATPase component